MEIKQWGPWLAVSILVACMAFSICSYITLGNTKGTKGDWDPDEFNNKHFETALQILKSRNYDGTILILKSPDTFGGTLQTVELVGYPNVGCVQGPDCPESQIFIMVNDQGMVVKVHYNIMHDQTVRITHKGLLHQFHNFAQNFHV